MGFLTGRQSKLAALIEDVIRKQLEVEIVFSNGDVVYGKIHGYELSPNHFLLTVKASKTVTVVNFRYVVKMRVQHSDSLNFFLQSKQ